MGMEVHVSGALSLLLLLLAAACTVEAQVFDIMKYGAAANEKTDISKAITDAWKEACAAAKPSTVLIPKGTYLCGAVNLEGPCKSSITLEVQGTLKAPADPAAFKGADGWFKVQHVDQFTINGGGTFDGQGVTAWKQNNCDKDANCKAAPMNFRFDFINGGLVQDVTSLNSKNFHVNVLGCKDFTFKKFTVTAPATSINTDGIHIGRSNGVNIIDTNIATGDDCISIGDGSAQVHITGVKCGPGHGISIGSLGRYPNEEPVTGIFVQSSTLTGTDNGLRIKSWPAMYGGSATDLHFEDITMQNVKNPILIDQTYCPYNQCNNKAPSKVKIKDVTFKKIKGTSATPNVVQLLCSNGIPCENVELTDITLTYSGPEGPAKSECANVKPTITGKIPEGC